TITNSGTISAQNSAVQVYADTFNHNGSIALSNSTFLIDSATVFTFFPTSSLTNASTNALQLVNGTVSVQTTNISSPLLAITAGTWTQQTNLVIPNVTQTGGTLRLVLQGAL